jgi:hypothetical protein
MLYVGIFSYTVRRQSDIEGTSVCYTIWPAFDISMSLAYVGMSSGGEVAVLVSFSIH